MTQSIYPFNKFNSYLYQRKNKNVTKLIENWHFIETVKIAKKTIEAGFKTINFTNNSKRKTCIIAETLANFDHNLLIKIHIIQRKWIETTKGIALSEKVKDCVIGNGFVTLNLSSSNMPIGLDTSGQNLIVKGIKLINNTLAKHNINEWHVNISNYSKEAIQSALDFFRECGLDVEIADPYFITNEVRDLTPIQDMIIRLKDNFESQIFPLKWPLHHLIKARANNKDFMISKNYKMEETLNIVLNLLSVIATLNPLIKTFKHPISYLPNELHSQLLNCLKKKGFDVYIEPICISDSGRWPLTQYLVINLSKKNKRTNDLAES